MVEEVTKIKEGNGRQKARVGITGSDMQTEANVCGNGKESVTKQCEGWLVGALRRPAMFRAFHEEQISGEHDAAQKSSP